MRYSLNKDRAVLRNSTNFSSNRYNRAGRLRSFNSSSRSAAGYYYCYSRYRLSGNNQKNAMEHKKRKNIDNRARSSNDGEHAVERDVSSDSDVISNDDAEDEDVIEMKPSFMAKLGQSMNSAGVRLFLKLAISDASMAIPHCECETIKDIDWFKMRKAGFTNVCFDKDNTLTKPYAKDVFEPLRESVVEVCEAFGKENVCIYSNSAGLEQYDPEGIEADGLERDIGIRVARHKEKKPSGSGEELARFFSESNSQSSRKNNNRNKNMYSSAVETNKIIFVGDRYLTDVVFGNKSGMFTIRCEPFDTSKESKAILLARAVEAFFQKRWRRSTAAPPLHDLDKRDDAGLSVYLKSPGARSWREDR